MFIRPVIVICVVLIAASIGVGQGDRWRQLVPLRSTREEAEKMIGKPMKHFQTYGIYKEVPGVVISAWYSDGRCQTDPKAIGFDVPAGVLTRLYVTFREEQEVSEFERNLKKFTKVKVDEKADYAHYYSQDESVVYKVSLEKGGRETVLSMSIQPAKENERQKCGSLKSGGS